MSSDSWAELAKSYAGPMLAAVIGAWFTAFFHARHQKSVANPAAKQPSRTLHLARRIGSFINRNWLDLVVVPTTFILPVRNFIYDLTAPTENVRVTIMWVALDVLLLSVMISFYIALYLSRHFAILTARSRRSPKPDGD